MKKDAQLTIRLPAELKAALRSAAARRDRSPNWLVVRVLEAWVQREQRKPRR